MTDEEINKLEALVAAATPTEREDCGPPLCPRCKSEWTLDAGMEIPEHRHCWLCATAVLDEALPAMAALVAEVRRLSTTQCRECGARLLFSARKQGDGLCGPCHRRAAGTQTEADIERDDLRAEIERLRVEAVESRANAIQAEAVFDEAARRLEAERAEARRIARQYHAAWEAETALFPPRIDGGPPDWLVKP